MLLYRDANPPCDRRRDILWGACGLHHLTAQNTSESTKKDQVERDRSQAETVCDGRNKGRGNEEMGEADEQRRKRVQAYEIEILHNNSISCELCPSKHLHNIHSFQQMSQQIALCELADDRLFTSCIKRKQNSHDVKNRIRMLTVYIDIPHRTLNETTAKNGRVRQGGLCRCSPHRGSIVPRRDISLFIHSLYIHTTNSRHK